MMGFSGAAFSPWGGLVALGGDEGVKLWAPSRGLPPRVLKPYLAPPVHGVAFSPDGRSVAAVGNPAVIVWDVATGQVRHNFRPHTINAHGLTFSPDGKRFATSSWGGYLGRKVDGKEKTEKMPNEVKVWDAATGKELATLSGGGLGVAFSPNGELLASGSPAGPVTIWDADTGKELLTLRGHAGAARGVAFSQDGKRLASAGSDATVKIWDTLSGLEVLTLRGHDEPLVSVAFGPDDRFLAAAGGLSGEPGHVLIWEALAR
jgi:WD40 repeat protein